MAKTNLERFAANPLAFFDALTIPSAHGRRKFRGIMVDFQRAWFQAVAPSLLAVAAGKEPPITRFWTERTKGSSKDGDAAAALLWLLAFSPRKLDMQVGAADRDQANELRKAAVDLLRLNTWLGERIEVQAWALVCRATTSQCDIVASDIAGSHGARPDVVCLNELSHIGKQEFAQNLMDNATKRPHGIVIICTNAGFESTWQSSWREMAQQSERWHYHAYAQPAPWLAGEEVEEAQRRNSNSRFNRLYWGQWVSQAGDALDAADIQACVDNSLAPMGKNPKCFYIGGLDLGIRHDHSAFVVVAGRRDTQELTLAYAQSWMPDPQTKQVNLIDVESRILELNQHFGGFKTVAYDPYACQLLAQRLEKQLIKTKEVPFVGKHLNTMASTLLEVFRSRRIRLYNHPQLVADLGRLTIAEKSYGYKLEASRTAQGGHADLAIALSIALPEAITESGKRRARVGVGFSSDLPADDYDSRPAWMKRHDQMVAAAIDDAQYEREAALRPDNGPDEMLWLISRGNRGTSPFGNLF